MQTLIEYSQKEFDKVKTWFPRLDYFPRDKTIVGRIDIGPCRYIEKQCGNLTEWEIEPCNQNALECISGDYLIEVDLKQKNGNGYPRVFEIGEKIERLANKLGKRVIDLHLYPQDKRCCLGINIARTSLSEFILYDVYPYFVWQAYYYKYRKVPPCGEYSHEITGLKEATEYYKKKNEYYKGKIVGKTGRNKPCPCGSNKKYKKCCLSKDEKYDRKANSTQLKIREIEKMEQNDSCKTLKSI